MNQFSQTTSLNTLLTIFLILGYAQAQQTIEYGRAFDTHTLPDDGEVTPRFVEIADFDGDGDMDIVAVSYHDNTIRWYENDSFGNFTEATINSGILSAEAVALADFDDDGDIDIAFIGYKAPLRWHENQKDADGNTFFSDHHIYSPNGGRHVFVADVNGDGNMDILTALYPNPTSSEVYLSYSKASNVKYSLYDMAGKRLATYTQSGTAHQLDVSSVSKGTYILKATSGLQVNYYRIVKE